MRTRRIQNSTSVVSKLTTHEKILKSRKDVIVRGIVCSQNLQHEVEVSCPIGTMLHGFHKNLFDYPQIRMNLMKHESRDCYAVRRMSTTGQFSYETAFCREQGRINDKPSTILIQCPKRLIFVSKLIMEFECSTETHEVMSSKSSNLLGDNHYEIIWKCFHFSQKR